MLTASRFASFGDTFLAPELAPNDAGPRGIDRYNEVGMLIKIAGNSDLPARRAIIRHSCVRISKPPPNAEEGVQIDALPTGPMALYVFVIEYKFSVPYSAWQCCALRCANWGIIK